MIYLSRLLLNPRSRQVQAELSDPYQMHRTLSRAFGDNGEFAQARCLFRVDEAHDSGSLQALVQSRLRPDWTHMAGKGAYLQDRPETKEFEPLLPAGGCFAFRLRANPTVKRAGKRLGLYKEDEQIDWLERKACASGFALLAVAVRPREIVCSRTTNGFDTEMVEATFDGLLRVMDTDKLAVTIASGIGSGKAFGFGLLSLARV